MPPSGERPFAPASVDTNISKSSTADGASTLGEFVGSASWTTTPFADRARNNHDEQSSGSDEGLGALLGAIADEVQRFASAVHDGINADFAARVAHARKHLPRHQLAAALAAFAEARNAALASAKQNAAMELQGRKWAAILARGRPRRRTRNGGHRPNSAPPSPKQS
jgi:hypothetical protein